jgi:hypothetical protein
MNGKKRDAKFEIEGFLQLLRRHTQHREPIESRHLHALCCGWQKTPLEKPCTNSGLVTIGSPAQMLKWKPPH